MSEAGIVVVGDLWHERLNELTYVARSIAGAASRWEHVTVLAPGPRGRMQPDGAFDVEGIGDLGEYHWPDRLSSDCVVVVDHLAPGVVDLLTKVEPRAVFYLAAHGDGHDPSWQRIHLTADPKLGGPFVKAYIPVNPLAELHRHNGFGFTGYQLVLSGRTGGNEDPPPAVAWLTSAFHDSYVVVVENAVASAWKGRALRGEVTVDTRMDLWRLIAHANVCIDLAPGRAHRPRVHRVAPLRNPHRGPGGCGCRRCPCSRGRWIDLCRPAAVARGRRLDAGRGHPFAGIA